MASVSSNLPGGSGLITRTSQLINDGEFPNDDSKFIESAELKDLVDEIVVVEGLADKNFVKFFPLSTQWHTEHELKKIVSVTCTDTAGTVIEGQVTINDTTQVTVMFNFPVEGELALN